MWGKGDGRWGYLPSLSLPFLCVCLRLSVFLFCLFPLFVWYIFLRCVGALKKEKKHTSVLVYFRFSLFPFFLPSFLLSSFSISFLPQCGMM